MTLTDQIPRADELTIDTTVLLFVAAVSVVTGVLAGALPALRAGRSDLNSALREGGRQDGAVGIRTRHALVVCEVALSVVLLMGAAVMLRSLAALRQSMPASVRDNVLTMRVGLPQRRYPEPARVRAYFDEAHAEAEGAAGRGGGGRDRQSAAASADRCSRSCSKAAPSCCRAISRQRKCARSRPAISQSMRIPVLRGRDVADNDEESCWSAAAPRSCCGATTIRSAGASRCRCSRGRSTRPSSASSAT